HSCPSPWTRSLSPSAAPIGALRCPRGRSPAAPLLRSTAVPWPRIHHRKCHCLIIASPSAPRPCEFPEHPTSLPHGSSVHSRLCDRSARRTGQMTHSGDSHQHLRGVQGAFPPQSSRRFPHVIHRVLTCLSMSAH